MIATMALEEESPAVPRLLHERAKPRIVVFGLPGNDVVEAVTELAGYVEHVPTDVTGFCASVRWADWDAVILAASELAADSPNERERRFAAMKRAGAPEGSGLGIPCTLPVFIITRADYGDRWIDDALRVENVQRACRTVEAPTPVIEGPAFDEFARLAELLAREIPKRSKGWHLNWTELAVWPLLRDADGYALAAMYARYGSTEGPPSFVIPRDAPQPAEWVRTVIRLWALVDRETFGSINDWASQSDWHTPAEAAAHRAAAALRTERAEVLAGLDRRVADLDAAIVAASADAVNGWRRLLTADGEALVAAVTDALRLLGFHVVDVDTERLAASKTDRAHDLDVTDPAAPGWIAMTEVKGYTNGAKATELNAFNTRMGERFILERGRRPDRRWFITNQFRNAMPDSRKPPLVSNAADVEVFSASDGAVIDTRSLFRLVVSFHDSDHAAKAALREVLRARLGVWPLDERAGIADADPSEEATG